MAEKYYPEGSPEGRGEALRRIAEAKAAGAEELDLGGLGLTEVPVELFDLAQLKVLYLGLVPEAAKKPDWQRTQEDKKTCNAVSALPAAFFTSPRIRVGGTLAFLKCPCVALLPFGACSSTRPSCTAS